MLMVVEPAQNGGSVDRARPKLQLKTTPGGGGVIPRPAAEVNALPHVGMQSYDERAAARYVLCISKEVLAMFANRQTPPGVAL